MIRIEKFALRADYLCPHHDDLFIEEEGRISAARACPVL
jgi:hypothetical protein